MQLICQFSRLWVCRVLARRFGCPSYYVVCTRRPIGTMAITLLVQVNFLITALAAKTRTSTLIDCLPPTRASSWGVGRSPSASSVKAPFWGSFVNSACDELLTRASFSGDQNCGVGGCDFGNPGIKLISNRMRIAVVSHHESIAAKNLLYYQT
jgi:hypothetical protein